MNVDEFQALLEACSNKSKIKTSEHAAMFSVSWEYFLKFVNQEWIG